MAAAACVPQVWRQSDVCRNVEVSFWASMRPKRARRRRVRAKSVLNCMVYRELERKAGCAIGVRERGIYKEEAKARQENESWEGGQRRVRPYIRCTRERSELRQTTGRDDDDDGMAA